MIYGRTVQLSPLVVLVSVLVGAELAGILGALAAIPVAGSIQVIVRDQLAHRRPAAESGGGRATLARQAPVAQWTERRPSKPLVGGSNPPGRIFLGRASVYLTSCAPQHNLA